MSDADDPAKKAAYQAWAERMRSRQQSGQQSSAADGTGPPPTAGYWSADSLFRDSELERQRSLEQQKRQAHIDTLLARLDLPPGSSLKECSDRVKQLARQVHPDMNLDATARTGKVNLETMVEINATYDELKRLL